MWATSTASGSVFDLNARRAAKASAGALARGAAMRSIGPGQKLYWEFRLLGDAGDFSGNGTAGFFRPGLANNNYPTTGPAGGYLGGGADSFSCLANGSIGGGADANYALVSGSVVSMWVDYTAGQFFYKVNNGLTRTIALITNSGSVLPAYEIDTSASTNASVEGLFKTSELVYALPSGFTALGG